MLLFKKLWQGWTDTHGTKEAFQDPHLETVGVVKLD